MTRMIRKTCRPVSPVRLTRLWREFLVFHRQNPWVYARLVEVCLELRARGFRHYSMRTLISVLRFEWDLRTGGETIHIGCGEEVRVKLNDHHSPYYARLLAAQYPSFRTFFEFRHVKAVKR